MKVDVDDLCSTLYSTLAPMFLIKIIIPLLKSIEWSHFYLIT